MTRPNLRRARSAARALRARYGMRTPPIDVFKIALDERVQVEKGDLGDGVSGLLVRDGDRVIIGVNALHVRTRQRFSVAHELGHHMLHGGRELFVDKDYLVSFRDSKSAHGTDPLEIEANQFAAELLMPADLVREVLTRQPMDIDDDAALRQLAAQFDVSLSAMSIRLSALGLTVDG